MANPRDTTQAASHSILTFPGTSLFVGCRIAKLPITAVVRPLAPLLLIEILLLVVVTYWPPFTMWLPRVLGFLM